MRPDQGNPLDLNNFPEDFTRDGKQLAEDSSSSSGYRRKKSSSSKDGKDDSGKVYECRFCSLKFCKSQALGGHMNRHRQERETENLNRARQLVYSNDTLAAQAPHHLGGQPMPHGGYHQTGDPSLPFRPVYPTTRLFPGTSSNLLPTPPPPQPPQHPSCLYTSPSRLHSYPSQYSTNSNDYFLGHVLPSNSQYNHSFSTENNYTCIGAPVGQAFPVQANVCSSGGQVTAEIAVVAGGGAGGGRSYLGGTQHNMDAPSSINRFHDGY